MIFNTSSVFDIRIVFQNLFHLQYFFVQKTGLKVTFYFVSEAPKFKNIFLFFFFFWSHFSNLQISMVLTIILHRIYGLLFIYDMIFFLSGILFIIEKFDIPVKMPWEKEVLWVYSFGYVWKIFIFTFLNTPGYTHFKKYNFYPGTLGWNYCHFWGVWVDDEELANCTGAWNLCRKPRVMNIFLLFTKFSILVSIF